MRETYKWALPAVSLFSGAFVICFQTSHHLKGVEGVRPLLSDMRDTHKWALPLYTLLSGVLFEVCTRVSGECSTCICIGLVLADMFLCTTVEVSHSCLLKHMSV